MNDRLGCAIADVFEPQIDEYAENTQFSDEHNFSKKHKRKIKKLIERQKTPYFKFVCTAGRRAACTMTALCVISTTVFNVDAVREPMCDFVVDVFSDHVEVTASSVGSIEIIRDVYVLSDIPEGFEKECQYNELMSVMTFYDRGNDNIYFGQYVKSIYYDVEFEKNVELFTDDDGQQYLISYFSSDTVSIVWDNGDYILHMNTTLDLETALDICRSAEIPE